MAARAASRCRAGERAARAYAARRPRSADEDVASCRAIGEHGARAHPRARRRASRPSRVNVLTHCNAGWLATVDWGTALAPIYAAHDAGMPVHVWVDETRPRNQGAALTAWELGAARRAAHGDRRQCRRPPDAARRGRSVHRRHRPHDARAATSCNKIGTYLKALAAHDNGVPFYVALPSLDDRLDARRRRCAKSRSRSAPRARSRTCGPTGGGAIARRSRSSRPAAAARNPAFDVTPARLVTGLITERGVAEATRAGLAGPVSRTRARA